MKYSRKTWIVAWTVFAVGLLTLFAGPPVTRFILEQREGHWYREFEASHEQQVGSDPCFVAVPVKHGSYFASPNQPGLPEYFDTSHGLFYHCESPRLWVLAVSRESLLASDRWPDLPGPCIEAMKQFANGGETAPQPAMLTQGIAPESGETVLVAAAKNYLFISHGLLDEETLLTMASSLRCE